MEPYKEKTTAAYNKHPDFYAKKFEGLFELERRPEFERFIGLLSQREPNGNGFTRRYMLDLGCGAGEHAAYFTKRGLGVTCVDISEAMVKRCKGRGLDACVMDIEDLKYDPALFHGIWAVTSLLHVPKSKMPGVTRKLHEILKHDGLLYVCVKEGVGEVLLAEKHDPQSERFFAYYQEPELHDAFKGAFSVIESKVVQRGNTRFVQTFFRKNNDYSSP
jgi:SAM-dependent methyltransferase